MQELLAEVHDKYRAALDVFERRRPFFDEHIAMYVGLQYGFQQAGLPYSVLNDGDQYQLREVFNFVQGVVRDSVSSRLQTLLAPGVVPSKAGVMARARAKASHRLMRSFLRTEVFEYEEIVRATIGASVFGAAWLKSHYDTSVGEFVQDESGTVRQVGDARVRYFDVYEVLPLMQARTAREVKSIFHRKRVTEEEALEAYPTDIEGKTPVFSHGINQANWDSARQYQDVGQSHTGAGSYKAQSFVEVVEFWEKPCVKYPGGRFVAFSGNVLLLAEPLPHKWPWRMLFGDNIVPGGLYPQGSVRPVTPLQKSINKIESKINEWILKLANPKWVASKNSGIDESQILSDEIALVTYNPNQSARPEIITAQMPSAEIMSQSQRLASSMITISGHSGLSQGQVPTNVDSARGMAFLAEREAQGRAPDKLLFARTIAGCLKDCLELYRDFVDEGRLLTIFGETGGSAVLQPFLRGDYDFDAEIVVDVFGGLPESPAQRAANAFEIAQAGGFDDTPTAKRFRKFVRMDHDSIEGMPDPRETHAERNLMEQTALVMGDLERIFVLPQDADDEHLERDEEFMVTAEFLNLPPEVQTFYRNHVAMHESQRNQKLMILAQEQQMMQPGAARQAQAGREAPQPNAPQAESPGDGGWGPATPTE
jgi:hypothetical protein